MRAMMAVVVMALASTAVQAGEGSGPLALAPPKEKPHRPVGVGALAPHADGSSFTLADVAAYVDQHNLPMNRGDAKDVAVTSVEAMTVAEFAARIPGDVTGFEGGERLVLALIEGRLLFASPREAPSVQAHKAYAAFDAVTGNLLYLGTLPD
jgi:hypothetical protein